MLRPASSLPQSRGRPQSAPVASDPSTTIHHRVRFQPPPLPTSSKKPNKYLTFPHKDSPQFDPLKVSVQDLTTALVREFLVAKGYRKTLEVFGQEEPLVRKETRISTRSELVKLLGIGRIIQANRELQALVYHLSSRASKTNNNNRHYNDDAFMNPSAVDESIGNGQIIQQQNPLLSQQRPLSPSSKNIKSLIGKTRDVVVEAETVKKQMDTGDRPPILGAFESSNPKSLIPATRIQSAPPSNGLPSAGKSLRSPTTARRATQALEVRDFDEEQELDSADSLNEFNFHLSSAWAQSKGLPLSPTTFHEVLDILFPPRTRTNFGEEWLGKGFVFKNDENLRYGLVQLKGGPCGLLAAVQAFVIKYLRFNSNKESHEPKSQRLRPSLAQCRSALVSSLAEILHQASSSTGTMVVVLKGNQITNYTSHSLSGFEVHEFYQVSTLKDFLEATISQFMVNGPRYHGIIQFLFSLILTRGLSTLKRDMDEPESRLMGRHGYCTQEMVNLILLGQALSNVHDNDLNLGGEPGREKILKGVKAQSQFGQLSLFEHYQNLTVGEHLKSPVYPIWVICSESHYSILFGLERPFSTDLKSPFDLFYYDGLANQEDEIRLTITPLGSKGRKNESELVSPIELCVRTKWASCKVDWNGTDPLL